MVDEDHIIPNNFPTEYEETSTYYRMIVICDKCGKRWVTKKKKTKNAPRCTNPECKSTKTRRIRIWKVYG